MKSICKLSVLLFLIITLPCLSQASKDKIFSKLKDKYGNVSSLSLEFSMQEGGIKGTLNARKGNKYRMDFGSRLIICNGKTIWNYSPDDNKSVISNFEANSQQISLEDIFFSFIDIFEPIDMKAVVTSRGRNSYMLKLKPKSESKHFRMIKEVNIWIDRRNYSLQSFQVIEEGQTLTWRISKLKIKENFSDDLFEFQVPKGCTVVDLR